MIYRVEGASKILLYFLNDRVINLVSNKMIVCSNNRLCYNQVGSNPVTWLHGGIGRHEGLQSKNSSHFIWFT